MDIMQPFGAGFQCCGYHRISWSVASGPRLFMPEAELDQRDAALDAARPPRRERRRASRVAGSQNTRVRSGHCRSDGVTTETQMASRPRGKIARNNTFSLHWMKTHNMYLCLYWNGAEQHILTPYFYFIK